jgi:hypothetical protein
MYTEQKLFSEEQHPQVIVPKSMSLSTTVLSTTVNQYGDIGDRNRTELLEKFEPFMAQAIEWKRRSESLVVTDVSQLREMKMAREARLALRDVRINADKTRKYLKEEGLRYGRAVQGVYNVIESAIVPIEAHLEKQEKFKEIHEMKLREALRIEREQIVGDLREYFIANLNLGEVTEDGFQQLLEDARQQKQQVEDAARKAEEERIAKEKAEAEERERLRLENERLKAEQIKAKEEEARIRKEAEAKAAEARMQVERLEAELRAKQEAEVLAAQQKIEIERISNMAREQQMRNEKAEADAKIVMTPVIEPWSILRDIVIELPKRINCDSDSVSQQFLDGIAAVFSGIDDILKEHSVDIDEFKKQAEVESN